MMMMMMVVVVVVVVLVVTGTGVRGKTCGQSDLWCRMDEIDFPSHSSAPTQIEAAVAEIG